MKSEVKINRILIAAPRSGSGKTMFTCGLLNLLKKRGLDVTSFKCGPDYIDPMFHKKVLGIYGGNLDTFFCSHDKVREILGGCGHECAVIEGVMGIYDGLGGLFLEGSCYDVAKATSTPIILIMDAKGAGRTLVSTIKGILADDSSHLIKGVILNKVSSSFYERLKAVVSEELKESGYDVRLLGCIPELKDIRIDSRHLGLMMPDEIAGVREMIDRVSENIRECCDVDGILEIMDGAAAIETLRNKNTDSRQVSGKQEEAHAAGDVRLAVAMDDAFCFYYRENLELLERLGAEIVFFSPLKDEKLPDNIDGIYIGGGYPELHLEELESNGSMRSSIREAIKGGIPAIAECGGFMYLHDYIKGEDGTEYSMVGAVEGNCSKQSRLVRFGYVELENRDGESDGSFARALKGMRGHEFHYYDSTDNGSDMTIHKAGADCAWEAMYVKGKQVFGFPHMYFESAPEFAKEFVKVMRDGRR